MGFVNTIGKYQLGRTIGEGNFAKVKLAVDTNDRHRPVAIKVIDKHMVHKTDLKSQVQREITTMKLLHHPNIVRIHEVIGSKTKIYLVMEYVSGGQLSDKLSYVIKFNEAEARKIFQQLIDAVDHCHQRGVYHRDLKPENLLLDSKGNLKVSDFGLSALCKPGGVLSTACGSPCYVAPELIRNMGYEGAPVDVWSCGVILFELLAGYLPFDDRNLIHLYKKICRAEYTFPEWFTESQRKLISRIFNPDPEKRITVPEIMEDPWFQTDYEPSFGYDCDGKMYLDDVRAAFESREENDTETRLHKSPSFINAFQLIAMSHDLDLSGLFEEDETKHSMRFEARHTINETIQKIEAAATDMSLSIEKRTNLTLKMHPKTTKTNRSSWPYFDFSAEVIKVAPTHCVVEISKSTGDLEVYNEFCKSLSSLLINKSLEEQESGGVRLSISPIQEMEW